MFMFLCGITLIKTEALNFFANSWFTFLLLTQASEKLGFDNVQRKMTYIPKG